jgi:hypothetical protein
LFSILDTHDGIGLQGVKGILHKEEIELIMQNAKHRGGYVSYKTGQDGKEEPYEINSTWWSAVNQDRSDEPLDLQVKRFIALRPSAQSLTGAYDLPCLKPATEGGERPDSRRVAGSGYQSYIRAHDTYQN